MYIDSFTASGNGQSAYSTHNKFVNAPCAAGKTRALLARLVKALGITPPVLKMAERLPVLVQHAKTRITVPDTDSHLVSFPTRDMCNQFERDLIDAGLRVDGDEPDLLKITSTTHPGRVVPELLAAMKNFGGQRKIIICCHESLFRTPVCAPAGLEGLRRRAAAG